MIELAIEIRWQDRQFAIPMEGITLSEQLGYDALFTAGGDGSACMMRLAYVAALTLRLSTISRRTSWRRTSNSPTPWGCAACTAGRSRTPQRQRR
jgi:hypothetical protein